MTARVYRCTRCAAVATVYVGGRPPNPPGACPADRSLSRSHVWRLAL